VLRWEKKLNLKIVIIPAVIIIIPLLLLLFFTVAAYNPPVELTILPEHDSSAGSSQPQGLTLLTWNLGYAGLDRYTDFFMDGGRMSHPRSKKSVQENLEAIQGH
jgi:hypothetical protein